MQNLNNDVSKDPPILFVQANLSSTLGDGPFAMLKTNRNLQVDDRLTYLATFYIVFLFSLFNMHLAIFQCTNELIFDQRLQHLAKDLYLRASLVLTYILFRMSNWCNFQDKKIRVSQTDGLVNKPHT